MKSVFHRLYMENQSYVKTHAVSVVIWWRVTPGPNEKFPSNGDNSDLYSGGIHVSSRPKYRLSLHTFLVFLIPAGKHEDNTGLFIHNHKPINNLPMITKPARSKAWTLFIHSNTGNVGSNPTRSMDVCALLFYVCVLCLGSGLATGWSPVQGVLPTVYRLRNWKSGQGPQGL
jgi:hypothetical protein